MAKSNQVNAQNPKNDPKSSNNTNNKKKNIKANNTTNNSKTHKKPAQNQKSKGTVKNQKQAQPPPAQKNVYSQQSQVQPIINNHKSLEPAYYHTGSWIKPTSKLYLRKGKCVQCQMLNTFGCEHMSDITQMSREEVHAIITQDSEALATYRSPQREFADAKNGNPNTMNQSAKTSNKKGTNNKKAANGKNTKNAKNNNNNNNNKNNTSEKKSNCTIL
jgi:hypothetical protein